jgi:quercetin dioxygenase-like cupin family protein
MSRLKLLTFMLAIAGPIWAGGVFFQAATSAQGQSNFVGGTPASVDASAVRTSRLRFAKGSRSNWHSHTWGQLLMIEEGVARTQVRGGPVHEMKPGQPWWTAAGVEHWHGASPDQDALQLTIYEGTVKWLELVTDDQYRAAPKP